MQKCIEALHCCGIWVMSLKDKAWWRLTTQDYFVKKGPLLLKNKLTINKIPFKIPYKIPCITDLVFFLLFLFQYFQNLEPMNLKKSIFRERKSIHFKNPLLATFLEFNQFPFTPWAWNTISSTENPRSATMWNLHQLAWLTNSDWF